MNSNTKVIPVKLDNGSIIRIQATSVEELETEQPKPGEEIESNVSFKIPSLDDITDSITGIAEKIKKSVEIVGPTKVSVEFGIEVGWESGQFISMIAKGDGKVDFKITLEWEKKDLKS
ncbi:MAG: CU044_2847 family protein [Pseudanabaena sp. ELA645]|jgi:hypothetical protein